MRKYLIAYNLGLQANFIYRYNFMILAVAQVCPLITTLLVWNAIFASSGKSDIQGYGLIKMITYLLLSFPYTQFVSLWFMDYEIASDIRNGQINSFLLRPISYINYRWILILARKTILIFSITLPIILIFIYMRHSLMPPCNITSLIISLLITCWGLYVNFLITYCAGLVAFWLLDVSSLFFIYYILSFFLSGGMFPLDLLPAPIYQILGYLPFQFMGYYQIKVYLGDFSQIHIITGLCILLFWTITFQLVANILWKKGTHKYSAYGG